VENNSAGKYSVSVKNLSKRFGTFLAVNDVSFNVRRGEIFGFLGPNGAGKSTTIRMLCGIIAPTSGDGYIDGHSILTDRGNIKLISGYMSQKFSLYGDLTPAENLEFYGGVYGLPASDRKERISWALEMSGLIDRSNDLTAQLPAGFKQRLALGASILHKPSVLFLDEPTAGVDPLSRRDFWDLIYNLSADGVTIFVTTHYMDEAEHCDRIAFIDKGALIKLDTPTGLKSFERKGAVYEIISSQWIELFNFLRARSDMGSVSLFGTSIHLDTAVLNESQLKSILDQEGIMISSIKKIDPTLEDVFVSLMKPE
jgi:ABC-2 type transport system ATP-binding protein